MNYTRKHIKETINKNSALLTTIKCVQGRFFSHPALESKQTERKSEIQSYEKSYRIAS